MELMLNLNGGTFSYVHRIIVLYCVPVYRPRRYGKVL